MPYANSAVQSILRSAPYEAPVKSALDQWLDKLEKMFSNTYGVLLTGRFWDAQRFEEEFEKETKIRDLVKTLGGEYGLKARSLQH